MSTETFQKAKRITNISFKELYGKSKPFNSCLEGLIEIPSVVTVSHPLNRMRDYSQLVRMSKILDTFSITESGISRPKIIKVQGDNGKVYTQLVKGGDDMRQDAVMEQVFENVNYTFGKDERTRKRRLAIRTYKIVPTSPQTGDIVIVACA